MAEHHLQRPEVRSVLEQMRRKGVPDAVGRQRGTDPGLPAIGLEDLPEALPGHCSAARGQKKGRRAARVELAARLPEIPRQPPRGAVPERNEAVLASLPPHAQDPGFQIDRVLREPDELRDSQARGVEQLEHRPVAQAPGRGVVGSREERLDFLFRERLRQRQPELRALEIRGRVAAEIEMESRIRVERAQSRKRACGRARREPARAERGQIPPEIRPRGRPRRPLLLLEKPPERREVAPVGLDARGGEPPLDGQMVEEGRKLAGEKLRGRAGVRTGACGGGGRRGPGAAPAGRLNGESARARGRARSRGSLRRRARSRSLSPGGKSTARAPVGARSPGLPASTARWTARSSGRSR